MNLELTILSVSSGTLFYVRVMTLYESVKNNTTLNHIKYNFDILERDYLPESRETYRESQRNR